jgi:hypothetical protein
MSKRALKCLRWTLSALLVSVTIPALGGTSEMQRTERPLTLQESIQKDSADKSRMTNVDEMARRVDSLQFIVVYNAQLLRRDLDSKVIWIYVMLGVMIIASMMMYGALNQAQRQRKDLEERVFNLMANTVSEIETKIRQLESSVSQHHPPKRPPAPKKKK